MRVGIAVRGIEVKRRGDGEKKGKSVCSELATRNSQIAETKYEIGISISILLFLSLSLEATKQLNQASIPTKTNSNFNSKTQEIKKKKKTHPSPLLSSHLLSSLPPHSPSNLIFLSFSSPPLPSPLSPQNPQSTKSKPKTQPPPKKRSTHNIPLLTTLPALHQKPQSFQSHIILRVECPLRFCWRHISAPLLSISLRKDKDKQYKNLLNPNPNPNPISQMGNSKGCTVLYCIVLYSSIDVSKYLSNPKSQTSGVHPSNFIEPRHTCTRKNKH